MRACRGCGRPVEPTAYIEGPIGTDWIWHGACWPGIDFAMRVEALVWGRGPLSPEPNAALDARAAEALAGGAIR